MFHVLHILITGNIAPVHKSPTVIFTTPDLVFLHGK